MEAISRTKRLLPQKRKNQKIREPLVLKGSLEIICDSSIKLRRLFFRFQTSAKIVVIGWVNDDSTLRAYESKNDAYKVFARMLDNGNPPSNWDELLSASHECDFEL